MYSKKRVSLHRLLAASKGMLSDKYLRGYLKAHVREAEYRLTATLSRRARTADPKN